MVEGESGFAFRTSRETDVIERKGTRCCWSAAAASAAKRRRQSNKGFSYRRQRRSRERAIKAQSHLATHYLHYQPAAAWCSGGPSRCRSSYMKEGKRARNRSNRRRMMKRTNIKSFFRNLKFQHGRRRHRGQGRQSGGGRRWACVQAVVHRPRFITAAAAFLHDVIVADRDISTEILSSTRYLGGGRGARPPLHSYVRPFT